VQPAEFMKIGMILMMAKYFHDDFRPSLPSYGFLRLIPPTVSPWSDRARAVAARPSARR